MRKVDEATKVGDKKDQAGKEEAEVISYHQSGAEKEKKQNKMKKREKKTGVVVRLDLQQNERLKTKMEEEGMDGEEHGEGKSGAMEPEKQKSLKCGQGGEVDNEKKKDKARNERRRARRRRCQKRHAMPRTLWAEKVTPAPPEAIPAPSPKSSRSTSVLRAPRSTFLMAAPCWSSTASRGKKRRHGKSSAKTPLTPRLAYLCRERRPGRRSHQQQRVKGSSTTRCGR